VDKFIKIGDLYLNGHEYAGGIRPTPREITSRKKMISKGTAIEIFDEDDFYSDYQQKKIERKK
jgi:hypothetical protein